MQMFRRENHERTMQTRFYREDGVHCTKCGVSMTTEAYRAFLAPQQTPRKKAAPRKKKTEEETDGD